MATLWNLRKATLGRDDATFFLELRNQPDVRSNSSFEKLISWDEHWQWYQNRMTNYPDSLFIAEQNRIRFGYVRFDRKENDDVFISVALSADWRGQGLGTKLIVEGSRQYLAIHPIHRIYAVVLQDNVASRKAFAAAGYIDEETRLINGKTSMIFILESAK